MARAAYLVELAEAMRSAEIKENQKYNLLEVWKPVQIPVRWKEKVRRKEAGETVGIRWQEYQDLVAYNPGDVLYPYWREASEWEREEWKDLSLEKLKRLGVFRKNGQFSVQIVSRMKNLPTAVRQRIRHIPANLITRKREGFNVAGDAESLKAFVVTLIDIISKFLESPRGSPILLEQASIQLALMYVNLEKTRSSLRREAFGDIQLALQENFWQMPAATSAAASKLLAQRARDYEMAAKSISLGEKWLDLMIDTERRFRDCYGRLGRLAEKLQKLLQSGEDLKPADLLLIANEAYGIWSYLSREVRFNPYYQRIQEGNFSRLQNVKKRAKEGKGQTVLNLIIRAAAKLEAVAMGEKVTLDELEALKTDLF